MIKFCVDSMAGCKAREDMFALRTFALRIADFGSAWQENIVVQLFT